jgi:hypothetical protein
MKAATWKAVFAAMSPSPVFEAVAEFAEVIVQMDSEQSRSRKHPAGPRRLPWQPPEIVPPASPDDRS